MAAYDGSDGATATSATLLSLFSRSAFGDIDFGSSVSEREDPKTILPDPDEDLNGLVEKTTKIATLILAHRSIAGVMGMLTEEGDTSLTHEKLVIGQASALEKVQWKAWKEGYRLPPMKWSVEDAGRVAFPTRRHIEAARPTNDFAMACKVKALAELYADELESVQLTYQRGVSPIDQHDVECPSSGPAVTSADVANFEVRYPELNPLLQVQAKIVASMSNTVAKEHLGVECELQERRCAVHLVRAYEEQLRIAMSRVQSQVDLVRRNCEVIRSRANAMSAPFDVFEDGPALATRGTNIKDLPHLITSPAPRAPPDSPSQPRSARSSDQSCESYPSQSRGAPSIAVRKLAPPSFATAGADRNRFARLGGDEGAPPPMGPSSSIKRFFDGNCRAATGAKRSRPPAESTSGGGTNGGMPPPSLPASRARQPEQPQQAQVEQQQMPLPPFSPTLHETSLDAADAEVNGGHNRHESARSSPRLGHKRGSGGVPSSDAAKHGEE